MNGTFYIENEREYRVIIISCAIVACGMLKWLIFGQGYWWFNLPVLVLMEWIVIKAAWNLSRKYAVRDSILALEKFSRDPRIKDHEISKRLREITVLARELHELGVKP